ncbi:hybrid sensor histidine kinase/response regulator [Paraburkholderia sp. Tr-20389]|uniref:ATP-binding response regulator n=1 Tax=Paraburkholderia sp. Tr-20389 TaxID=2703903 RepID=UPI00197F97F2|nr:hybrid sensor histidine kinase/response regulator [Paraburkholderia sp. Tr-20389]MBN3754815.1 hybrid sensor histidine kinase/response regulator [Paraburkholderia sp. Tr-20389]
MAIHPARKPHKVPPWRGAALELWDSLADTLSFPTPFKDINVEREFLDDHGRRFERFRRVAVILGFFVWTCFAWVELDSASRNAAFHAVLATVLVLRFIGIAVCGIVIALSFRSTFSSEKTAQHIFLVMVGSAAGLLLLMVLVVPSPFNVFPFLGSMALALFYLFGMPQLMAKPAFWLACIIVSTIVLLQITLHFLDIESFLIEMFWLLNVMVVGLCVNVHSERHARQRFTAERELALSKHSLEILNDDLTRKQKALEASHNEQTAKKNALIRLKDDQKRAAEDASSEKSSFLAAATHDLRQPMHALHMFLAAAAEATERGDLQESQKLVTQARKSSVIMARLFDAVLDLSRLEAGGVCPDYCIFDLSPLVHEVVEEALPFAAEKHIALRLKCAANASIWVRSDPHWIRRILANLISNAVKYADTNKAPRCAVVIGVVRSVNRVRIDVVDNGIGIAQRHWDAIFRPFFQIGNPDRDRERGLGLGLATVNAMISMLDEHRIELKSAQGNGSRFSVEVPICQNPILKTSSAAPLELSPPIGEISGLYALLVEDDGLVRAAMEALFRQWGVLVESVSSASQLDEILGTIERYPDFIITDFRLADSTTARDVIEITQTRLGRYIPCLIITGEARLEDLEILQERYILTKPVTAESLKKKILEIVPTTSSSSPSGLVT